MHFKHISLAFACQSSNVLTLNHLPADSPGLLLIPYLLLSHLSIMRHSNTCHSCSRSRHSRYVCEFSSFVYINKIDDFERPSRYTFTYPSRVIHYRRLKTLAYHPATYHVKALSSSIILTFKYAPVFQSSFAFKQSPTTNKRP